MKHNIIASNSKGNCVIYNDVVMVDLGIKKKDKGLIAPFIDKIKVIIITHRHTDHIQFPLVKEIIKEYPDILWLFNEDVKDCIDEKLVHRGVKLEIPKYMVIDSSKKYNFGLFQLDVMDIYHDVPNIALYMSFKDGLTVFHATDTYTLDKITIPSDTDIVAIEHHHEEEHYNKLIEEAKKNDVYSHEIGANNSHLSFEKSTEFIERNIENECTVLRLHISTNEYYDTVEKEYKYKRRDKKLWD